MKFLYTLIVMVVFNACNLAEWNQKRLNKKFSRHGVEAYTYENDSSSIHYYKGGSGPYLLLIHGFGGDAQVTWEKTILELAKNYTVIAPDLLWFGQSTSTKKPNLASQTTALLDLLEALKVTHCSIAGVSYGGFVTLGMVQQKRMLFDKVCIIDSPGMTYSVALLDSMCQQVGVDKPSDIFVPKNAAEVKRLFSFAFHKKGHYTKGILKDAYELYFSKNHQQLEQLLQTLPEEQTRFFKDPVRPYPPTTVIWGKYDEVFPVKEGQKLANFLNADFIIIDDAGHAPMIEQPKSFLKAITTFLD